LFFLEEEKLHLAPVRFPPCLGRNDLDGIEDEDISWAKILRQVLETGVDDFTFPPPHDHHPRVVPTGEGPLSDELRREVVVEIGNKHLAKKN
jgi:hypothetical protein